ncbi:hypothetical protein [Micromonospora sp. NPDC051141]|uniref:hypothetical protein n=1 Tax=Micromonospora sp. NPDC051141 TaxID=3364284 RepID=UPI0037A2EFE7
MHRRTNPGTATFVYEHDLSGNLTGLTDGRGMTKHYYNTRNWLVRTDTARACVEVGHSHSLMAARWMVAS